jgi:SAM-dependent methyltransferase
MQAGEHPNIGRQKFPVEGTDYRAYVGPPDKYDIIGALQFNLLTTLGMREHHALVDIGCGSLRGGRLFIPYLRPGKYFGIEPNEWLVEEGIKNEIGQDMLVIKQPRFLNDAEFNLTYFHQKFDFLLAQSVFTHAASTQINKCLAEARQVMNPEALFAATYFLGEENYAGEEWVYPDRVTYQFEFMSTLASDNGLACRRFDWPHPSGQKWLILSHPQYQPTFPEAYNTQRVRDLADRLVKLESHPYVKFGLKIHAVFRNVFPKRSG